MKNYLFIICTLSCITLQAQLTFHSFQEVLDYADAHALAIKNAELNEQLSLVEEKEAKSYLMPKLGASFGYNDNIELQPTLVPTELFNPNGEPGTFEELNFGTKYNYTRQFQAQWDILDFQKIAAVETAKMKTQESKSNTAVQKFQSYNQLASTYYSILLTKESVDIYEKNVATSKAIYELATDKFNNGLISEADLNLSEIKILQTQKNLDAATNNLEQYYIQLQSQLNTDQAIVVTDATENFVLLNTTIANPHPEIAKAELTLKTYESMLKQTKSSRLPSLSLIYQNNNTWATDDFMNFGSANQLPQQYFGLTLSWNGIFGSTTKQKINSSKIQLELQQMQLENTRLSKQNEDELLQLQLVQGKDMLDQNTTVLELYTENDKHAENKYEGGLISLDHRLDAYEDMLAAQDNYLQSLASYTLAQYKLYVRQLNYQS